MNRALFITIGIVVIVLIFGLWLWLFFNSTPATTQEIFSDLGLAGETVERAEPPNLPDDLGESNNTVLKLSDNRLQQLTTAPIAGFRVASTSEGTVLRYAERGTGHIYSINMESGLQTQVSPNTFPSTVEAYFSPNLERVILVTDHNARAVTLVTLPNAHQSEATQLALDTQAENFQFSTDELLTYTINTHIDTKSYSLSIDDSTVEHRFTVPLPDAVVWTSPSNTTFAYPKPATALEGALYEVIGGQLLPVSKLERGLLPFIDTGFSAVSFVDGRDYLSRELPNLTVLPYIMLPEKCASSIDGQQVYCGTPDSLVTHDYLERWYKGLFNSDDLIWVYNTADRSVAQITAPKEETGRQIDITHMSTEPKKQHLFFINKIDSTLWSLGLSSSS